MLGDILATNAWTVTLCWFVFTVISSAKCHWHSHDKFRVKQNNVSVTSFTVIISDKTETVGATISCLVTFWELLISQLVATFSVGDHHDSHGRYAVRVGGPKQQNEHVFLLTFFIIIPNRRSKRTERNSMLILLLGTSSQVCCKNVVPLKAINVFGLHS